MFNWHRETGAHHPPCFRITTSAVHFLTLRLFELVLNVSVPQYLSVSGRSLAFSRISGYISVDRFKIRKESERWRSIFCRSHFLFSNLLFKLIYSSWLLTQLMLALMLFLLVLLFNCMLFLRFVRFIIFFLFQLICLFLCLLLCDISVQHFGQWRCVFRCFINKVLLYCFV